MRQREETVKMKVFRHSVRVEWMEWWKGWLSRAVPSLSRVPNETRRCIVLVLWFRYRHYYYYMIAIAIA